MTMMDDVNKARMQGLTMPALALLIVQTYSQGLIARGSVDITSFTKHLDTFQRDQLKQAFAAGGLYMDGPTRSDTYTLFYDKAKTGDLADLLLGISDPNKLAIKTYAAQFFDQNVTDLVKGKRVPIEAKAFGDLTLGVVNYLINQGLTAEGNATNGFTVWAAGAVAL